MDKNVFTLPLSFTSYYNKDEPNWPRQNNLILQRRQLGCEFPKDFPRPNNFQALFKMTSKMQDLFKIYEPWWVTVVDSMRYEPPKFVDAFERTTSFNSSRF